MTSGVVSLAHLPPPPSFLALERSYQEDGSVLEEESGASRLEHV